MTDLHPVYRLSQEAYDQLRLAAEENPEAYLDSDRDFSDVLRDRGVFDPFEETAITTTGPISLVPVAEGMTPHRADRQAFDFYHSFDGMSPSRATDERLWAWMTHFRLHVYSLSRWRRPSNINMKNYVRSHCSARDPQTRCGGTTRPRDLVDSTHGHQGSPGSAGAFTPDEALGAFSRTAVFYHIPMHYKFTRDPIVLAEVVRAILNEAEGIAAEKGTYALLRELNLIGGTQILPLLPREVLRGRIVDNVEWIMSDPDMVSDRTKIRKRKPFRSLSLGAGVQSTVLALMADRGEYDLPKPDVAIFADTGWEPPGVYEHLDWLEKQLSFEVVRVRSGNIKDNILEGTSPDGNNYLGIPAFLTTGDGKKAIAARQCTTKYKVRPINRYLRQRLGMTPGRRAPKHVHVEILAGYQRRRTVAPEREQGGMGYQPLPAHRSRIQPCSASQLVHRELPRPLPTPKLLCGLPIPQRRRVETTQEQRPRLLRGSSVRGPSTSGSPGSKKRYYA